MYQQESSTLAAQVNANAETSTSAITSFLSNLAFVNHSLRLGLLFSTLVLIHSIVLTIAPWAFFEIDPEWQGLSAWFISCIIVSTFDRFLLSHSVFEYRRSVILTLRGEFDAAIQLLEKISPYTSSKLVHCPPIQFNLQRAFIGLQAKALIDAQYCLERARKSGLDKDRHDALLIQIYAAQQDFDAVNALYEESQKRLGENTLVALEYGLIVIRQRNNWKEAKQVMRDTLAKPSLKNFSTLDTQLIAAAFLGVANLWSGRAEEGLEELNFALLDISSWLYGNEAVRPITATLLLERSLYYATHQEPEAAITDLKNALKHCQLSEQLSLKEQIVEELSWRHPQQKDLLLNL